MLAGDFAAKDVKSHHALLENLLSLLTAVKNELAYTLATPTDIFLKLSQSPAYRENSLMAAFTKTVGESPNFERALVGAVERTATLKPPEQAVFTELAGVLGSTDLEGQLDALRLLELRMTDIMADSREHTTVHAKLYRTLGTCLGAAVFILVI